eukprot:scaffold159657_cov33-Tisochrysis_lutea.AAC.4
MSHSSYNYYYYYYYYCLLDYEDRSHFAGCYVHLHSPARTASSTSETLFGAALVSTEAPPSASTRTSSSIRMPIPRHHAGMVESSRLRQRDTVLGELGSIAIQRTLDQAKGLCCLRPILRHQASRRFKTVVQRESPATAMRQACRVHRGLRSAQSRVDSSAGLAESPQT